MDNNPYNSPSNIERGQAAVSCPSGISIFSILIVATTATVFTLLSPYAVFDSLIGGFAGAFVANSLTAKKPSILIGGFGGFAGAMIAFIISILLNAIVFQSLPVVRGWQAWLAVAGILLWAVPGIIIAYVFSNWFARRLQSTDSQRSEHGK